MTLPHLSQGIGSVWNLTSRIVLAPLVSFSIMRSSVQLQKKVKSKILDLCAFQKKTNQLKHNQKTYEKFPFY